MTTALIIGIALGVFLIGVLVGRCVAERGYYQAGREAMAAEVDEMGTAMLREMFDAEAIPPKPRPGCTPDA